MQNCNILQLHDSTVILASLKERAPEPHVPQVEARRGVLLKRMEMPEYASKTPETVRSEEADRLAKMEAELAAVATHMEDMQQMLSAAQ